MKAFIVATLLAASMPGRAQSNSSSNWPATLSLVWPAIEYLHANTLEILIYWEQLEPAPGQCHDSEVELLLAQARQQRTRWVAARVALNL